jgi:voltage-gated potassium channel
MLPQAADEPRVEAWNRRVDWPLTALAVAFLVAYAWSVLDRTISPGGRDVLEVLLTGTWVVFGLDYLVRIALARRRGRFVLRHLPDLAVLMLPMIRPLRVLRLVTVITVLHAAPRGRPVTTITTVGYGDRYPVTVEAASSRACSWSAASRSSAS